MSSARLGDEPEVTLAHHLHVEHARAAHLAAVVSTHEFEPRRQTRLQAWSNPSDQHLHVANYSADRFDDPSISASCVRASERAPVRALVRASGATAGIGVASVAGAPATSEQQRKPSSSRDNALRAPS